MVVAAPAPIAQPADAELRRQAGILLAAQWQATRQKGRRGSQ